jgi:hypothetical protein
MHDPNLEPETVRWIDYTTGKPLPPAHITAQAATETSLRRVLRLSSYRSILTRHIRAPERKAADPDGNPCRSRTAGPLHAIPTHAYNTEPIGRESNYTNDPTNDGPTYTTYPDANRDTTKEHVLTMLLAITRQPSGRAKLAADLQLSDSGLRRYLNTMRGRPQTQRRAHDAAVRKAMEILQRTCLATRALEPDALLYVAAREVDMHRCDGCGRPLTAVQRRWCARCRRKPRLRALVRQGQKASHDQSGVSCASGDTAADLDSSPTRVRAT